MILLVCLIYMKSLSCVTHSARTVLAAPKFLVVIIRRKKKKMVTSIFFLDLDDALAKAAWITSTLDLCCCFSLSSEAEVFIASILH